MLQTCTAWEAIVVDNGPGLRVDEIVASFADPRLRYTYLAEGGEGPARNEGARLARGKYLAFLDDDDRFYPQKLQRQIEFLEASPDIGLVGCGAMLIDEQGLPIEEWPLWEYSPDLCLEKCIWGCYLMPTAILMRREWFEKVGGQSKLVRSGDTDLLLRLMLAGCRMGWIKELLCEYRIHSGSTQHDPVSYAECRQMMIEGILAHPHLPEIIRQQADEIRLSYALLAFAQCYAGGACAAGRAYLDKALTLQPDLREKPQLLAEAIANAVGRREVVEPYCSAKSGLEALIKDISLPSSIRRRALSKAAQIEFYRGWKTGDSARVLRNFVRAAVRQPSWLLNRGTWSILARSILGTNRGQKRQNEI